MACAPTDWQLNCNEMKQRGAYLLQSAQWSDCQFLVGTEPHQLLISGHKLILAMASPVFEAMFYGGMAERNEPIPILDVQPEAFKALLEYIYTDNINISSFDKACELCYGAKKYMLPHLVKECTRYLWSDLYPRNACRAYEFARLFEENVLMDKCLQIISTNTREVLTDSSFEDVELNTVMTVFSLDHLNVESELDLFEAAVRYARAHDKRVQERAPTPRAATPDARQKSPEPSTSKEKVVNVESSAENSPEAVPEAAGEPCKSADTEAGETSSQSEDPNKNKEPPKDKPTIRSAIEKIRFLTLTPQQFAEGPARSTLLTELESFAVLMNILSSNANVPMPTGFSTCRVPRKQLIGCEPTSNLPTFTVDTPSPIPGGLELEGAFYCRGRAEQARPRRALDDRPHPHNHSHHIAEFNKIYCQRPILQQTDVLNASVLDCSVTFMVDKNICLLGIQVPTQTSSEECGLSADVRGLAGVLGGGLGGAPGAGGGGAGGGGAGGGYSELLYAHLLDADGARLTYTHYTGRVPYRHLLDICFNRPVYIQRNKVYKVSIVFNKVGWYPMGTCAQQAAAESVFFNFCIGQSGDSVRDGLVRSIIFTY